MRLYVDDDGKTVGPRPDTRKPRPKLDLSAERLSALRLEWLADRLLKMSEPVSEDDRRAAAAAARDLAKAINARPVTRDNSKPGTTDRKKLTEFEHCAVFVWHKLHADATKHGRKRWKDGDSDQRTQAAKLAIARAESAYPLQKGKLSVERLFKFANRSFRAIKLHQHFESLHLLDGFFAVPEKTRQMLRAKPRK